MVGIFIFLATYKTLMTKGRLHDIGITIDSLFVCYVIHGAIKM